MGRNITVHWFWFNPDNPVRIHDNDLETISSTRKDTTSWTRNNNYSVSVKEWKIHSDCFPRNKPPSNPATKGKNYSVERKLNKESSFPTKFCMLGLALRRKRTASKAGALCWIVLSIFLAAGFFWSDYSNYQVFWGRVVPFSVLKWVWNRLTDVGMAG